MSNVDSQESAKGILVQVIGEMSNRAAPHRKFVQTFVLAEQPTGYYVLNDIFRYILDEEEEEEEGDVGIINGATDEQSTLAAPAAPAPVDEESVPATLTSSNDPVQQKHDAEHIDRKLEEEVLSKTEDQQLNGVPPAETPVVKVAEDAPAAAVIDTPSPAPAPAPEQAAESAAAEEQSEKPRDPDPTPIASPPKPAKAAPAEPPAAPPKPAAPKTWANLVASKGTPAATTSTAAKAAPPATPAPLKPKATNPSTKESTTPTTTSEEAQIKPQQNGNSGWQMAGADNKQRQGRQHSQSISSNQDNVLGYVKNVTEKVDASILKDTLTSFGKLAYFDVSRQKVR